MSEAASEGPSGIGRRRESARRERSPAWLERRTEILNAAAEVFRLQGFNGTSITDIANRLGINQSNVYYYFGKKEEIFLELVRQAVDYNVAEAESAAASTDPPVDRLARIIGSLAGSYERHYPFLHLYVQEDVRWLPSSDVESGRYLRECGRRFEAAVLSIVSEGIEGGSFAGDLDARMITYGVLGTVNWMHRWFVPGAEHTAADIADQFSRMILRGLVAERVPPA
ncbi:MAG TPA: TetR/AcrR family transcriptional regulator [Pseudonocardia sp.]|nr:TetR/AcrR family transcriptional regulator [Pseudonocardia sp.]